MLVLTLKPESVTHVAGQGSIRILEVRPNSVRVGFEDGPDGQLEVVREDAHNKRPPTGRGLRRADHA